MTAAARGNAHQSQQEALVQQQVERVDHVAFVYRKENFEQAKQQLTDALGIDDWDGPAEIKQFNMLHAQSLKTGIEVLSPLTDEGFIADHLRSHGEGFFALVFGVADVHEALRRAQARGIQPVPDENGTPLLIDGLNDLNGEPSYPSWQDKLKTYLEIPLLPVAGLNFYFGQIEPA
jgi:4-hydroxyphenylpyruvate dioxygenase-like putative hemolysin